MIPPLAGHILKTACNGLSVGVSVCIFSGLQVFGLGLLALLAGVYASGQQFAGLHGFFLG
jgi:hypothetical protein